MTSYRPMPRFLFIPLTLLLSACAGVSGQPSAQQLDALHAAAAAAQKGDLENASAMYRELASQPETAVAADIALADIDRKQGRNDEALAALRDAQAKAPNNPQVLAKLGYALSYNGQSDEAVKIFDQLIAKMPNDPTAYSGKAVVLDNTGSHVSAQMLYRQALALTPDSLSIQNNLAMSMILNGQIIEAIALLEQLNMRPDANAIVRQNLALAYGIKGNKARALELNLRDVTPEQAQENLKFYEEYASHQKSLPPVTEPASMSAADSSTLNELLGSDNTTQQSVPNSK